MSIRNSKKWVNRYWFLHRSSAEHVRKRPYILPIFAVVIGLLIVVGVVSAKGRESLKSSDSHVVFLYDGGKRQTIDTKSETVGDLVSKLPLKLVPEDVVEPDLDTKIVEDNFRINVYRARPVTIVDTSSKNVTLTAKKSPIEVARSAGIDVYPEDNIEFQHGSLRENIIGEKVVIDRATPVGLNLYGSPLTIRTRVGTVNDLLKEKGIKPAPGDTVQPAGETPITPNLQVFIARMGTKIITSEIAIPAPVQIINDATLSLGATAVKQAGSAGTKAVTYQIQTMNGKETGRTVIQEVLITQPVPQIVARGTIVAVSGDKSSIMAAAGIAPGDYGYVNYIISRESGWRVTASNPSGAYGLCQALPGSKMASAGADWASNPVTQLKWCSGYAVGRYGSWAGAYNFWVAHHYW